MVGRGSILYGAGYMPDHLWWLLLQDDPGWVAYCKDLITKVPDDPEVYAAMIRGRRQVDAESAEQEGPGLRGVVLA